MPCDTVRTKPTQTFAERQAEVTTALKRLEVALLGGRVRAKVGPTGGVVFVGWDDRDAITDVCAYRTLALTNSWALRQAVAKAEALAGRRVDARAVAAGVHSHDGGASWGRH